jgi:hypothetical protein
MISINISLDNSDVRCVKMSVQNCGKIDAVRRNDEHNMHNTYII